jgi:hypothetical protein
MTNISVTFYQYHSIEGAPTRFIQLDPKQCKDIDWDSAVNDGCEIYSHRMHNIITDNCHSHVAKCLDLMVNLLCTLLL